MSLLMLDARVRSADCRQHVEKENRKSLYTQDEAHQTVSVRVFKPRSKANASRQSVWPGTSNLDEMKHMVQSSASQVPKPRTI